MKLKKQSASSHSSTGRDVLAPLCDETGVGIVPSTHRHRELQLIDRPPVAPAHAKHIIITHKSDGAAGRWSSSWNRLTGKKKVGRFLMDAGGDEDEKSCEEKVLQSLGHTGVGDNFKTVKFDDNEQNGGHLGKFEKSENSKIPQNSMNQNENVDNQSLMIGNNHTIGSWRPISVNEANQHLNNSNWAGNSNLKCAPKLIRARSMGILLGLSNAFGFNLVWNERMTVCRQCIKVIVLQILPIVTILSEFVILFDKYSNNQPWKHHDNLFIIVQQLAIIMVLLSGVYMYRCQQQRTFEKLASSLETCTTSRGQHRRSLRLMASQLFLILFTLSLALLAVIERLHVNPYSGRTRQVLRMNHYSDYIFAACNFWGACQIGICVSLVAQGCFVLWAEINNFNDSIKELAAENALDSMAMENAVRIHSGLCRAVKVFNQTAAAHLLCMCLLASCILPSAIVAYQQVYSKHLEMQSIGWTLFSIAIILELLVVATFVQSQFRKTAEILHEVLSELPADANKVVGHVQLVIERSEKVGLGLGPLIVIKRETVVLMFFIYGLYFGLILVLTSQSCEAATAIGIGGSV